MSHWSEQETTILLDIWREDSVFEEVASKNTRSKKVYDRLVERLHSMGIKKTVKQVRSKIKNLKSEYKKVRDTLRTSGEAAVPKGKYYDLIDEVLGGTPSVDPPAGTVLESTTSYKVPMAMADGTIDDSTTDDDADDVDNHIDDIDDIEDADNYETALEQDPADVAEEDGGEPPAPAPAAQRRAHVPRLVSADESEEDQGNIRPQNPERDQIDQGKRKGGAAANLGRKKKRCEGTRESVKESLDKIIKSNREHDYHYRKEMVACRQADSERGKDEMETMRQMIDLARSQLENQREEAERRDRRERAQREQDDRKWAMFFSSFSTQPRPFQPFPGSASQPGFSQQHTGNATYTPTAYNQQPPRPHMQQPPRPHMQPAYHQQPPRPHMQPSYSQQQPRSRTQLSSNQLPLGSNSENGAEEEGMKKTYHTLQ